MNAQEQQAQRDLEARLRILSDANKRLHKELEYERTSGRRRLERQRAKLWRAADEANARIEELLVLLERIELIPQRLQFSNCKWCGDPCLGPACREHFDLMSTADLLEEALGA